jgi:hypothetical protein
MEETVGSSLLHAYIVIQLKADSQGGLLFSNLHGLQSPALKQHSLKINFTLESTWACLHRQQCKIALKTSFTEVLQLRRSTYSPRDIIYAYISC